MVASPGGRWLYWGCRTGCIPVGLRPAGANVAVSLIPGIRGARVAHFTGESRSHSQKD